MRITRPPRSVPPPISDNILHVIPGEFIGTGSRLLPPAETVPLDEEREVELEVPYRGTVRIRYKRRTHRHGNRIMIFGLPRRRFRCTADRLAVRA